MDKIQFHANGLVKALLESGHEFRAQKDLSAVYLWVFAHSPHQVCIESIQEGWELRVKLDDDVVVPFKDLISKCPTCGSIVAEGKHEHR